MLAVLALVLQPPPPGLGELYMAGPYVVFFRDGSDRLSRDDRRAAKRIRADQRILSAARVSVCLPEHDARERVRRAALAKAITVRGGMPLRFAREGKGCTINGGSRRVQGMLAYQIEFGPAD